MKKLLIFLGLAVAFILPLGATAFATDPFGEVCERPGTSTSEVCRQDGDNPVAGDNGVLTNVVNIVAAIAGVAAVIVIIVAGLQFIAAGGDSNKITNARNAILYALAGLVFIALARSIIVFIINRV